MPAVVQEHAPLPESGRIAPGAPASTGLPPSAAAAASAVASSLASRDASAPASVVAPSFAATSLVEASSVEASLVEASSVEASFVAPSFAEASAPASVPASSIMRITHACAEVSQRRVPLLSSSVMQPQSPVPRHAAPAPLRSQDVRSVLVHCAQVWSAPMHRVRPSLRVAQFESDTQSTHAAGMLLVAVRQCGCAAGQSPSMVHTAVQWPGVAGSVDVHTRPAGQPLCAVPGQHPSMHRCVAALHTRPDVALPQSESVAHPQNAGSVAAVAATQA